MPGTLSGFDPQIKKKFQTKPNRSIVRHQAKHSGGVLLFLKESVFFNKLVEWIIQRLTFKYRSDLFCSWELFGDISIHTVWWKVLFPECVLFTCIGRTIRATQIMMTTSSWEGQIWGVTSPNPTVEKVTTQKYRESKSVRLLPARSKCWIPQILEEREKRD